MDAYKRRVVSLLENAGIEIGGPNSFDIQVNDERFYEMVAKKRSLGAGEAYVLGYWQAEDLKTCAEKVILSGVTNFTKHSFVSNFLYEVSNAQSKFKSVLNVKNHYDIGYSLYRHFLDETMAYSCAYWRGIPYSPGNLKNAQEQKFELICRKLGLNRLPKGQRILDVGCGFGGFAKYAATKYGAIVVGITLSRTQFRVATRTCRGLPIQIRFQDYRDIPDEEKYDHIVSVGMLEHVGGKNLRSFAKKMKKLLRQDEHGENVFLLHTIFTHDSNTRVDPWIEEYIFPGSEIPSRVQLAKMIQDLFVCEDFHTFGPDYSLTADAWFDRFDANYPNLMSKYQTPAFQRTWEYYLRVSSASFLTRRNDLVQMVLTHNGLLGGQEPIREVRS